MLKSLKLTCFRQHLDRTFEFGPGLNAIRGENEAGKTTVLEAYVYFCFGSGALRESIEHVVTYHHAASKLRVDCELEHLGVTYRGYRGKSGAEVTFGAERVTGQREVTKFFERLFGTTADMAGKLMFASQKSLAESLKAGPTEAGRMIEDLANFDLIDRVAESIATRRQTGNTTGAEARVATLQAQLVEPEVEDLAPLRAEIADAEREVHIHESSLADLRARRADLDVELANKIVQESQQLVRQIETASLEISEIDQALKAPALLGPADDEIAAARAAVEAEKQVTKAAALHAELTRTNTAEMWDKDLASLEAEVASVQAQEADANHKYHAAAADLVEMSRAHAEQVRISDVKIAQLEGRLIKETTCALCQKDLADVPEVARTNSELQVQINTMKLAAVTAGNEMREKHADRSADRDEAVQSLQDLQQYLKDLQAVIAANAKVEQLYARAADYIEVDRSVVPGRWRWIGPNLSGGGESAVNRLALLERRSYGAQSDAVRRSEKLEQRQRLAARRDADVTARSALPLTDAAETLEQAAELDQQIKDNEPVAKAQVWRLQTFQSALSTKEALATQAARQLEQTRTQLAAAEAELASMQKYNALIKKVRAVRPVITNKLWNIVLAGVSKHFSEVRGQVSNIARADGMFKCNGFPVSGLSGSAEDMLGLSMRIALTKTFLPGADFLQLDEPGAACSDARETRMLGMLSTLNFGQIIMISHNDLVDSVADRIITV